MAVDAIKDIWSGSTLTVGADDALRTRATRIFRVTGLDATEGTPGTGQARLRQAVEYVAALEGGAHPQYPFLPMVTLRAERIGPTQAIVVCQYQATRAGQFGGGGPRWHYRDTSVGWKVYRSTTREYSDPDNQGQTIKEEGQFDADGLPSGDILGALPIGVAGNQHKATDEVTEAQYQRQAQLYIVQVRLSRDPLPGLRNLIHTVNSVSSPQLGAGSPGQLGSLVLPYPAGAVRFEGVEVNVIAADPGNAMRYYDTTYKFLALSYGTWASQHRFFEPTGFGGDNPPGEWKTQNYRLSPQAWNGNEFPILGVGGAPGSPG